MKQALELFKSKSFLKAEKLFLQADDPHRLDALKYLYLISKSLGRADKKVRHNDYLYALGEEKMWDELLSFHYKHPEHLEVRNYIWMLESLWLAGRVSDFFKTSKWIWNEIIDRKLYAHAEPIHDFIKTKNPCYLLNEFSFLLYLLETGDGEGAKKQIELLLDLLTRQWPKVRSPGVSKANYLRKLLGLVLPHETTCAEVAGKALLIRKELSAETMSSLTPRSIIEYVIFFKDNPEQLIELLRPGVTPYPEKLRRTFMAWPSFAQATPKMPFEKRRLLEPVEKNYERLSNVGDSHPSLEQEELKDLGIRPQVPGLESEREEPYAMDENERNVIARIKASDPELVRESGEITVIHSLLGVGFFEAALALIEKYPFTPEKYYIKCHVLHELKKYHRLDDLASELLNSDLMEPSERLPFLYLLARAKIKLGKKEGAVAALKDLVAIDPNFRDTKELLANAKA